MNGNEVVNLKPLIIAIDGNCGSGKTTLSKIIQERFACNVFHMDDYYLPFEKRDFNWEMIPGGNIDTERFLQEVLLPAGKMDTVTYQPYFCREKRYLEKRNFPPTELVVVEGSYCQLPMLSKVYDLRIFLTCSKKEQERRLRLREGARYPFYEERWIPMEERYYEACSIQSQADWVVETTCMEVYDQMVSRLVSFIYEGGK